MSAISNFLTFLRSAIYAIDVRDGIADAIEQCYNDVNNPTLKTEALEAALQTKIDEGEMAALTIGDGTISAAKLASGVIDNTLATSGAAADAKKTGDEIAAVKADLGAFVEPSRLDNGTDLNNVTTPGVYLLHTNNTYENKPTSDVEHGILEVWDENMPNNVGRIFQRLTYTFKAGRTNCEIWTRSYSRQSQSWNEWLVVGDDFSDIAEVIQTTVRQTVYTPISYNVINNSSTVNGITFSQSTNHKVTVTGTATSDVSYALVATNNGYKLGLPVTGGATYRLRGCPTGGSNNTYRLDLRTATSGGTVVCIDTGDGIIFTPESTGSLYPIIRIANGKTVNLEFEVVLEQRTYAEVAGTPIKTAIDVIARNRIDAVENNQDDIMETVQATVRQAIYTPISYSINNNSTTVNGITFSQSTNHKVTVTGTAAGNAVYALVNTQGNKLGLPVTGGATYRLRGCPTGGSNNTYRLDLRTTTSGGVVVCIDTGDGIIFTPESTGYLYPIIRIGDGETVNLVFELVLEQRSFSEAASDLVKTAIDVIARNRIEEYESSAVSLTPNIKRAILACFQHVCWDDEGSEYYTALEAALNESENSVGGE